MTLIKKLDLFILKAYLQLFAGSFFVCLFIFMMQFLWRWLEDLVGKGLSYQVLAQFFYYSALNLVPTALPLAVLLASLITFGNMGERLELLSMKAAGIPLVRVLQPVLLTTLAVSVGSFYFQNRIGPDAMKEFSRLVWSMKQKSPEMEIPEGVFYNEIPGYNIYVQRKDTQTGMLYGVMIYSNTRGYEDAEIVVADSGHLQSTADRMHLQLTLHHGERFRNMDSRDGGMLRANVPYMRESFIREIDLIPFDNNFNMLDASLFAGDAQTKNIYDIAYGIDSLTHRQDSIARNIYTNSMQVYLGHSLPGGTADSARIVAETAAVESVDSFYLRMSLDERAQAWQNARRRAQTVKSEAEFRAYSSTQEVNYQMRRHWMELYKKFTLSLACLLFFFIGAPLGAIIRKGGLGVPVVISVIFFIFYYIVDITGFNMARSGQWTPLSGIWISSAVLLPIGMFLTNRANKDSVVFNVEGYRNFFMALFGLRDTRKINRKEVIIHEVDYRRMYKELEDLTNRCLDYQQHHSLRRPPSYIRIFFRYREDNDVVALTEHMEQIIDELHNSRDAVVIVRLGDYPIVSPDAHTRPFRNAHLNTMLGIIFPLGLLLWVRIARYRLRLWRDFQVIIRTNRSLQDRMEKTIFQQEPPPNLIAS
ncbi:MAG: YjgP/YjgQ family permease [Bacteroidaceae bacterium]|nr:YjgP/YjgQ family permease [Bacteroidaceae bacterium]